MNRFLWLLAGVGLGAVVAHFVSRTPAGQRLFAPINERIDGFTHGVREGYREREAELRTAISGGSPADPAHSEQ